MDRPSKFIITDGYDEVFGVFHAMFKHIGVKCDYSNYAVRESGTATVSNVVRFFNMLPAELRLTVSNWVYS